MVVHLAPALLAVVDDVETGLLEQAHRVARRPVLDLGQLGLAEIAAAQKLERLLAVVEAELLAPALRLGDVTLLQRTAGESLHPPGQLGERADLSRQEPNVIHAAASVATAVLARPSRTSFSRAIRSGTYCRSPLGTSASSRTPRSSRSRRAKAASSCGSSSAELRASTTPASRSLSRSSGTASIGVA